jgi:hypothetical protein
MSIIKRNGRVVVRTGRDALSFGRAYEREREDAPKLCRLCDQPMKPKGVKKLPNEYDHALGCPYGKR